MVEMVANDDNCSAGTMPSKKLHDWLAKKCSLRCLGGFTHGHQLAPLTTMYLPEFEEKISRSARERFAN